MAGRPITPENYDQDAQEPIIPNGVPQDLHDEDDQEPITPNGVPQDEPAPSQYAPSPYAPSPYAQTNRPCGPMRGGNRKFRKANTIQGPIYVKNICARYMYVGCIQGGGAQDRSDDKGPSPQAPREQAPDEQVPDEHDFDEHDPHEHDPDAPFPRRGRRAGHDCDCKCTIV